MEAPEKIWATGVNTNGSWTNEAPRREWDSHAAEYIRADIAEELARALEWYCDGINGPTHGRDAISRFRALTP